MLFIEMAEYAVSAVSNTLYSAIYVGGNIDMKSIRTKITLCLILTVLVSLVASGASGISLNYNSTMSTVEQMMTETAVLAAGRA